MTWRQRGELWICDGSPGGPRLEFIGGNGLGTSPQLSYRRLLEALARRGWTLVCWPYLPGFDHQLLAAQACRSFRRDRERSGASAAATLRLGHSLGCKLQLLAPDGGRGCRATALMSFNNYGAERSVPLLAELGPRLGVRSEFSPSPARTLACVREGHGPPQNLLLRFRDDGIDQSAELLAALATRPHDASVLEELPGDHLAPASAGLRQQWLGGAGDGGRQRQIETIAATIDGWWQRLSPGAV
jgi:hypothetical protein